MCDCGGVGGSGCGGFGVGFGGGGRGKEDGANVKEGSQQRMVDRRVMSVVSSEGGGLSS